ncbi:hypothetical protein [Halorussus halobius]|uniref:hypothetical protein n=1 Tax=Halorussus halobius TaxID=1710537 RepID=UPI0010930F75|nr:hypothetical protein [Halorussus halobius]
MGKMHSRRWVLQTGAAVGSVLALGPSTRAGPQLSNELRIESDGGGVAAYEFTVTGSLQQVGDGDHVDGNRAWGHVGPDRDTDRFQYTGDLDAVVLAGPATLYRGGTRTRTAGFPQPDGTLTSANLDPDSGTNELRIESDGGGVAAYEFAVTGSVEQVDDDDDVAGYRAWGHVGPERGGDTFEFTGEVTRFELAGPASVSLNGSPVTPDSGGSDPGLVRAAPDAEITATPGTTVLFEAAAPGYPNRHLDTDWYVDGREYVAPGAFHGQTGGRGRTATTYPFESTGTHEVTVEAYERDESGGRGQSIGSTEWTVEVGPEGNTAPTVELVAPDGPIPVSRDSPERRTFEVSAADPEGALDRVVWWESQCDYVVAVATVSGRSDAATLDHAPSAGCPLGARAVDRDGAVSDLAGWRYETGG